MRENMQRPIPADYNPSGVVKLHSDFPTIQGEGPFCGERAIFFRLFGCNLRCPGCDTEYTSTQREVTPEYFVTRARELDWQKGALVVITGGEPFRQNIVPAIAELLIAGYRVQIETNGVLWPVGLVELLPEITQGLLTIVCSPKTQRIHELVHKYAAAFKYVLRDGEISDKDGLPTRALLHPAAPQVARPRPRALVYVQPMDENETVANALNLDAAIRSTMKFGHRLQIQVHKHINME